MTSVLHCGETKHFNNKMKGGTFALIENYQNLVKSLNEGSDSDDVMMGLDQEVPLSPFCDVKREIKLEPSTQPIFCDMSNYLSSSTPSNKNSCNYSSGSSSGNSHTISSSNIPTPVYEDDDSCIDSNSDQSFYTSAIPSFSSSNQSPLRTQSHHLSSSNPSLASSASSSSSSSSSLSSSPSPLWSAPATAAASPAFHHHSTAQIPSPSFSSPFVTSRSSLSPSPAPSMSSETANPTSFSYATSLSSSSPLSMSSSSPSHPSHLPFMETKEKTFISELGQNGCTLLSSVPNFLSASYTDLAPSRNQEEFPEYTDLDRLPGLSFYDELISASPKDLNPDHEAKQVGEEGGMPLEVLVGIMRDSLDQDRRKLSLPQDPQTWTCSQVARWVKWVCQKNNVSDISGYIGGYRGAVLCSWSSENFTSQYGVAGSSVFQELELWKAASSYELSSQSSDHEIPSSVHLPSLKSDQLFPTPSTSPAPSHGSNSQDLLNSSMDNSEDEVFYSDNEHKPAMDKVGGFNKFAFKPVSGRGHKKAIVLWQFILGLLTGEEDHSDCIRWLNRESRIFKIEDSKKVATLWGKVKSRPAMNYDKLSRSMRQYYKKGIIKKPAQTKRLVYQFCPGIY